MNTQGLQGMKSDIQFNNDCGNLKKGTHEPSLIFREFLDMRFHLEKAFLHCSPECIIKKCSSLMASDQHNIPLFCKSFLDQIRKESNMAALIQMLGPYFIWTDYSILCEIIEAACNMKAAMLLSQFESRIDYSQPLNSFPIAKPLFKMFPKQYSTHTVLAAQLHSKLQNLSLYDLLDIRNFIVKKCELTSHAVQLLSMAQNSSKILYWMICRSVVPLVTSKILQRLNEFYNKGITLITIHPDHILATGGGMNLGSLPLISDFEEMVRIDP